MPEKKKPLWTCPRCGHQFVTPNMWHSCSRHALDDHFKGKAEHPRFFRIESPTPRDHIHRFRLTELEDIDEELAAFIREAYAVGCQEPLNARLKRMSK